MLLRVQMDVLNALEVGSLDALRRAMDSGLPDLSSVVTKSGATVLHRACQSAKCPLAVLSFMLTLPTCPSIDSVAPGTGMTPLHVAAQQGRRDMVEELLAKGASVTARTQKGEVRACRLRAVCRAVLWWPCASVFCALLALFQTCASPLIACAHCRDVVADAGDAGRARWLH